MTKLLLLLSTFYQCDAAIAQRTVSIPQLELCMAAANELKAAFLTEGERSLGETLTASGQLTLLGYGYRRFKTWETEHEDLVRHLRWQARARIRGDETV